MKKIYIIVIAIFFGITLTSVSQTKSNATTSTDERSRLNVLKWNLTPMIWNGRNINLSYERVTSDFGSFSVNAGYFLLPSIGLLDSINMEKANKQFGFTISGDKRYYFKKRNKRHAPDGLYWGIFGSVHYYEFENSFTVTDSEYAKGTLILNGDIGIFSAGVELGYQFVLKNNITIDLIFMGPALSSYTGKLGIKGDLQVDKESEYIKAIYDVLVAKYPGVDKLLDEKSINDKGTVFSLGPGLRYMVQIGYRF